MFALALMCVPSIKTTPVSYTHLDVYKRQALQRSGVQVFLRTGRHALEIAEENMLPGITVDGAVYMNGQLCELQGRCV